MSSLRISHQNRGIGPPSAGGDTGRSEHAEEGASFAVALGAAAGVAPKDAVALPDGKSDDGGNSPSGPRKRMEAPTKSNDSAVIAASAAGALIVAPVAVEPAASGDGNGAAATGGDSTIAALADSGGTVAIANSGGFVAAAPVATTSAGALAAPLSAPGDATGAIQNVAGKIAFVSSPDVVAAAQTGTVLAAPDVTASIPTSSDVTMTQTTTHADTASSAPALSSAAASMPHTLPVQGGAPSIGTGIDASQTSTGVTALATGPDAVVSPAVSASHLVTPVQASAAPALPVGAAKTEAPSAATVGAAADASGLAASPAVAPPAGPGPGTPHIATAASTAASGLPSSTAGQPMTADGGGAPGFAPRDRFVPVISTPDAGDIAATSTNVAAGNPSTPTVSSAAPAPSLTPDASSPNTVVDQVAGQLARMVSNGSSEMVMRLHPPELGDLTVRVAVSGRDVAAWFASPQPLVQTAISAAIGQLQTNLGNAGYNLNGAWVGADTSSARQQQNSSLPTLPSPRTPLAAVTALPDVAAAVRSSSSGLNVYV